VESRRQKTGERKKERSVNKKQSGVMVLLTRMRAIKWGKKFVIESKRMILEFGKETKTASNRKRK